MVQSRGKGPNKQHPPRKLRSACDVCHQAKTKCTGGTPFCGTPCTNCRDSGYQCRFSVSNRIGRPRGTKNKRTLDRMSLHRSGGSHQSELNRNFHCQAQPVTTSFDDNACRSMTSPQWNEEAIDSALGTPTDRSHTFTGFRPLDHFSDDPASWYSFDDLSGSSIFTQQPPCIEGSLSHESRPFSQVFSTYMSPSSLFNDMERFESGSDLDELFGNMNSHADEHRTMTTLTSSWSIASSPTCNCVQNHAELLCHLQKFEQRHLRTRLDTFFSRVQQALVPWKSVLECEACQHNGNQEVLMLSGMTILTVLRSLQSLCSNYCNTFGFGKHTEGQEWSTSDASGAMQSMIGTHEVAEERRTVMEELLIVQMLDKIRYTMTCFKGRLENLAIKKNATSLSSSCQVSRYGGDLDDLMQVWWDLNGTVQALERVLKGSSPIPAHVNFCLKDATLAKSL